MGGRAIQQSIASFLAELRRRQVFRVAAWYGASAWLLIQIASTVAPQYELPLWTVRAVIGAAVLGFPVALLLAWAFEVTLEGVRRTEAAASDDPKLMQPAWRGYSLWFALAAGALLAVGSQQAWRAIVPADLGSAQDRKSIAVLPLASLSEDPDDQHFTDGLHEDIISTLAKIADLRVISRTSVMEFRGNPRNLRDIAATLGVATVLEGSVRRSGDQVKITLQLIDAASDSHLWAEDYERPFTDVFALQAEIAQRVAERLDGKVTPQETKRLTPQATNLEAFTLYAKARSILAAGPGLDGFAQARALLESAVAADPSYAPAWALLAGSYGTAIFWHARNDDIARGRAALRRAQALAPDSADVLRVSASYVLTLDWDWASAEVAARRAVEIEPSSAGAHNSLAFALMAVGRVDEAIALASRAVALDPQSANVYQWLAYCLQVAKRFDEAERVVAEGLRRFPDSPMVLGRQASQLRLTGRAAEAVSIYQEFIRREPDTPHLRLSLASKRRTWIATRPSFCSAPITTTTRCAATRGSRTCCVVWDCPPPPPPRRRLLRES